LTHSGQFAAKAEFHLEERENGASCNGVEPNVHQDKNIYHVKMFEPGLSVFKIGAWFYIKKPEHKNEGNHAQKFFYLLAKGSSPRFVLATTYDESADKHSIYITYNTGTGGSHSLYGDDSELKPKDRGSANGILNLPYDQWFYLELAVAYKTHTNVDSAIHVYYATEKQARTEVFRKTKHWSADHCDSSTTRTCPAFPDDSMIENKVREFRVGAQVDRHQDRKAYEIRYWDDVTIEGE
jgi:hypothetical protein